ncbi:MAG: hypothetical protein MAG715_00072 [Methanonatronarchaeales archaeon]|nr:hypothetical protein [Methanonatronarchaeales archaeon]
MIGTLVLLFVAVPLVELYVLLELSKIMGIPQTVALVLLTGAIGGVLARHQGLRTIRRIREKASRGEPPPSEMVDGALVLVGAAFLLTPGVLTDATGFLLLLPLTRPVVRNYALERLGSGVKSGRIRIERFP